MTQSVSSAAHAMKEALTASVRRRAWWFIVQGVLRTIAGLVALIYPLVSALAAVVIIGWLLIVSGIVQALTLIGAKDAPHFWLQLLSVALGVIVGLLLVANPGEGLVALSLLLIVYFFIEGMAKTVFALMVRPLPNWWWLLLSGVAGMVLAAVLWSLMPISAAWLLGLFLGITLIAEGAVAGLLRLVAARPAGVTDRAPRPRRCVIRRLPHFEALNTFPDLVDTFARLPDGSRKATDGNGTTILYR